MIPEGNCFGLKVLIQDRSASPNLLQWHVGEAGTGITKQTKRASQKRMEVRAQAVPSGRAGEIASCLVTSGTGRSKKCKVGIRAEVIQELVKFS